MTLTEFLLARVAEDEAAATGMPPAMGDLARAICRVKRRQANRCAGRTEPFAVNALLDLAAPYSDHPDFRGEWTP